MLKNLEELKEQIVEKNILINSIKSNDHINLEKKRITGIELDKLLYAYFKSFNGLELQ